MNRFSSIFSQLLQLFPRVGVSAFGHDHSGRAPCERIPLLEPICVHALLPIGPGPFPP